MKTIPALHRPGALIAAGVAAWPVFAALVVRSAGVGGCVRSHGVVGFIATHGAMMREVPSCPATFVGAPASVDTRMSVILAAAIIATLLQGIISVVGTRAAEWIHRVAEAIWSLIVPPRSTGRAPQSFRLPLRVTLTRFWGTGSIQVPWGRDPPTARLIAA